MNHVGRFSVVGTKDFWACSVDPRSFELFGPWVCSDKINVDD